MPELTLAIDASRAQQGAQQFEAAVRRIETAATRAAARVDTLGTFQGRSGQQAAQAARGLDRYGAAANDAATDSTRAARAVDKLGDEAQQTGTQAERAARKNRQLSDSFSLLRAAITGVAIIGSVRAFVRLSDAATQVENRLRLVTSGTEELATVQARVFQQAQEARTPFEAQAELYQRVARSAQQLGESTAATLDVTEAVAKAITISGVSADAANASIIQLGQGLASGALRGDELRSVLEQTPRLASAIAQGLGVTVGQLRELGAEGELTSEAVFQALLKQLPELRREFSTLQPTFAQAGTVLENSFIRAADTINDAVGISAAFSQALLDASEVIDTSLVPGLVDATTTLKGLAVSFIATLDQAIIKSELFTNGLLTNIAEVRSESGFFDDLLTGAANASAELNQDISELPGFLSPLARLVASPLLVAGDAARSLNDATEDTLDLTRERKQLEDDLAASQEGAQQTINDLVQRRLELQEKLNNAARGDASGQAGGGGPTAEQRAAKAEADKLASELQRLVEGTATPLEQLEARLKRLQELRDIAPDTVSLEVFNRAVQQAVDQFAAADPAIAAYNAQVERASELTKSVNEPQTQYNESIAEYNQLLAANLISQQTFNALQAEARERLDATDEALKRQNELLTQGEALRQSLRTPEEARNETLSEYQQLLEAGAISQTTFNRAVGELEAEAREGFQTLLSFSESAGEALSSNLTDLFLNPGKEGFRDFANSAIDDLQRLAAEALKNLLLQQLFGGFAGGGGIGGALAGAFLPGRAGGGPVESGRPFIVGEREPEVFVPRQSGTILNGEQMADLSPTINNTVVVDTKGFTEALNTPKGSKDLLNAISVNRTAIKSALK